MSSPRADHSSAILFIHWARSRWLIRGQGPRSNASRAATTARSTSASWASATLRKTSSLALSWTCNLRSPDGATQSPPMKQRSGCWIGWVRSAVSVMDTSSLCRARASEYPSSVTGDGATALFRGLRHLHARRLGATDQLARPLIGRLAVAHDRLAADEGRDIAVSELMQPLAAGRQVGDDPRVVQVELGIVDHVDVGAI